MGVVRFCVVLDKSDKVYYSGDLITGRVELVTDSEMKIRSVQFKIKGRAKCKWHYRRSQHSTGTMKASEIYIVREQILVGGKDKFSLSRGNYIYPFEIILPDNMPSSFSGRYGEVSYYGKAKIDIPFAFDKKERTAFSVIQPFNLNSFSNLRVPYKDKKFKTFWCLCCASGPLTVTVRLPRTGFAATESIPITLEVDNASSVSIHAVNVYLKRKISWIVKEYHKKEDFKLRKIRLSGVEAGQSHTWNENFTIPSNLFPNLDGCKIIKIDHELHIEADACGLHSDLDMHIPVTIADVLVLNESKTPTVTPKMEIIPDNMVDNSGIQVPSKRVPSLYPNLDPPVGNYGNSGDAPFGEPPLQICPSAPPGHVGPQPEMNNEPSNPTFVAPSPHLNAGEISQIPAQENSVCVLQYPPQAPPALPSHPSQSATNPECSQNAPHPSVAGANAGYGLAFPSFNSNVQLERTSFLSDSKGQ